MLADGCEAYVRSQNPETDAELRSLIKDMVDRRVKAGQLINTELTLKDLNMIIDSYTATLKGTHHARVDYPENNNQEENRTAIDNGDVTVVEKRE
jgi:membrane-associated HD superfamily phosphohydrolase